MDEQRVFCLPGSVSPLLLGSFLIFPSFLCSPSDVKLLPRERSCLWLPKSSPVLSRANFCLNGAGWGMDALLQESPLRPPLCLAFCDSERVMWPQPVPVSHLLSGWPKVIYPASVCNYRIVRACVCACVPAHSGNLRDRSVEKKCSVSV